MKISIVLFNFSVCSFQVIVNNNKEVQLEFKGWNILLVLILVSDITSSSGICDIIAFFSNKIRTKQIFVMVCTKLKVRFSENVLCADLPEIDFHQRFCFQYAHSEAGYCFKLCIKLLTLENVQSDVHYYFFSPSQLCSAS